MLISLRKAATGVAGVAIASVLACSMFVVEPSAYADEEMATLNAKVEETAQQYNEAVEKANEIDARVAENQERIEELQTQIDGQKDVSSDAVKSLYLYQRSAPSIVNLVFSSSDVEDLFGTLDYLNRYEQSNLEIIESQVQAKEELETTQEQLEADKAAADEAKAEAEQALKDAQTAREEAMKQALAEAEAQLEAERQTQEARIAQAKASAESDTTDSGESSETSDDSATTTTSEETPAVESTVSEGEVDWAMPKEDFVNTWAARIDAYLAGSPLEGYGRNFAEAAWTYGVDPRWSPAISNTESSKGLYCFLPHNAWGWGSSSWSSWEEAIDAHVAGLSRGYGFTITLAAAMKYCPPTYQEWYNNTLAQMEMI